MNFFKIIVHTEQQSNKKVLKKQTLTFCIPKEFYTLKFVQRHFVCMYLYSTIGFVCIQYRIYMYEYIETVTSYSGYSVRIYLIY